MLKNMLAITFGIFTLFGCDNEPNYEMMYIAQNDYFAVIQPEGWRVLDDTLRLDESSIDLHKIKVFDKEDKFTSIDVYADELSANEDILYSNRQKLNALTSILVEQNIGTYFSDIGAKIERTNMWLYQCKKNKDTPVFAKQKIIYSEYDIGRNVYSNTYTYGIKFKYADVFYSIFLSARRNLIDASYSTFNDVFNNLIIIDTKGCGNREEAIHALLERGAQRSMADRYSAIKNISYYNLHSACGTRDYMAHLIKSELEVNTRNTKGLEKAKAYFTYFYLLPGRCIRWVWNSIECITETSVK